ncbi:MAG: hypothetical protein K0R68_205 [Mycobacterium sp.]|nr:hypothetical protein [Mycobacterium sp.]
MSGTGDPEEAPLIDEVREALDGQPLDLLELAAVVIEATADEDGPANLDELVTAFIGTELPETTALLAVLRELAPEHAQRLRCRQAVVTRHDPLPRWLAELSESTVGRAVLMTDVFGDGEEVLIGLRLADGQELTCAVNIDHLHLSSVKDAFFVPESIDTVLAVAQAGNDDPDTEFVDLDRADAGATLQTALDPRRPLQLSDTWPTCRPLVRWLVRLLPDGGTARVPDRDPAQTAEVLDRFFGSLVGMSLRGREHRELLRTAAESGTGDPLRWSTVRLHHLLGSGPIADELPAQAQLTLPALLRAFVPFAHAAAGIRQDTTAAALAAIDEQADTYRAAVLGAD